MKRVIFDNVSKAFRIGFKKRQSALSRFASIFSGKEQKRSFWVLKNISFDAEAGEMIGIIGKNGSGKSTLLRVIAGIYSKDKGTIVTNGNMISLIGLFAGLKEKLSTKDNIYLCCSIFGLNYKTIKKKFSPIIEFAELGDFINTKIYQLSTGMRHRLVFSIAIHCDPEILLLDEVFAGEDENFKKKSAQKINKLIKSGTTVLLATHYLEIVERQLGKQCDKILLMKEGRLVVLGNTRSAIEGVRGNV